MRELVVQNSQISYAGAFAEPAFPLWGQGGRIVEGLMRAFQPHGVRLSDFRTETGGGSPADEAVAVHVGKQATYRFRFDRIEASLNNFSDSQLGQFSDLLTRGTQWLRTAVPTVRYVSHLVSFGAHSRVDGEVAADILKSFQVPHIDALGATRGAGVIWHGDLPKLNANVQLTIDRSLLVTDGLFTQFIAIVPENEMDFGRMLSTGRDVFNEALSQIGLLFNDGQP